MYTIEPKKITFSFTKNELMEQLERLTAKTAEITASASDIAIAPELYCITSDDDALIHDLMTEALDYLAGYCGKNGGHNLTDDKVEIVISKTLYLDRNAPLAEIRLRNMLVRKTLSLWYERRGMNDMAKAQQDLICAL